MGFTEREEHQVQDDTIIWRYLDLSQYLSILENGAVWFSRVDQYDDPFEGFFPQANLEAIAEEENRSIHDVESQHSRIFAQLRKLIYANCWHINEKQSDAMWKLYLEGGNGLAVQSTVGKLREAIQTERDIHIGKVRYIDWTREAVPVDSEIAPAFYKREEFEHEQELRAAFTAEMDGYEAFSPEAGTIASDPGLAIDVTPPTLIDRVFTSPHAPEWFHDVADGVTDRYGLEIPVTQSGLYADPYE